MIKFNRYHVTNGTVKAKCWYNLDNRTDRQPCVTIYGKDYSNGLGAIFADLYKNDTDFHTDYFDKGKVVLFADHPLYAEARARVEQFAADKTVKAGA